MGCAVCALRLPLALCTDGNFSPQYIKASSLYETVQSLISKDGQVAVVEDENQLVVMDNALRLELIRQTLRKLDSPRRQVRITALIYDVSLEDIERLGINWASSMKGATNAADAPSPLFSVDSVQAVPLAADAVHGAMTFMTTSDLFDLTAAVNALQTANDARLLADPNVVVLDREAANIRIVTEIPYQERTQTSEGGNIGWIRPYVAIAYPQSPPPSQRTLRPASDGSGPTDLATAMDTLVGRSAPTATPD